MPDPISQIAPWPKTAEEATADAVCKSLTVCGVRNLKTAMAYPSPDEAERRECGERALSMFCQVYVLRAVRARYPEFAEVIAQGLWSACEAGHVPPEMLWCFLKDDGNAEEFERLWAEHEAAMAEARKPRLVKGDGTDA